MGSTDLVRCHGDIPDPWAAAECSDCLIEGVAGQANPYLPT